MTGRQALAKTIGALNIAADVELNPDADNYLVTTVDGKRAYVDSEVAEGLRYHYQIVAAELAAAKK